ncbi:unnamed protein product [Urochloa humidicola]
MGAGDRGRSEEEASVGVGILKTAEESQPAGTGTRKKGKEGSTSEGGEILKKRKEAMEALDLLLPTKPTEEEAKTAGVEKKRRKIVKVKVPQDVIDSIMSKPCKISQKLSDEDLADKPQEFREAYNRARLLEDKVLIYEQALISQYKSLGFAEDEIEVTDDEETVENQV